MSRRVPAIPSWLKLDNAAKIYPATSTRDWTAVFRLSISFKEAVDPVLLQKALENTLKRLPLFAYRLKNGLFWPYLDKCSRVPVVQPDVQNPCMRIHYENEDGFLFRVRYYQNRVAAEFFHVICDGTGGLIFLCTLSAEYLRLKTGERYPENDRVLDVRDKPDPREWEDSFQAYAGKATRSRKEEIAWPLKDERLEHRDLAIISGKMSTSALKDKAREYHTTINSLLSAVLLQALIRCRETRGFRRRDERPIKISLPVNLRRFYPSKTLRNFSSYVNVAVYPQYGEYSLKDLIALVSHEMGRELVEPLLKARVTTNVMPERSPLLRLTPLPLKTLVLKLMYRITGERYFTMTFTNLGQVVLPGKMASKVERMDMVLGPSLQNPLVCGCVSVGDTTLINFTRTGVSPDVERYFFNALVRLGIPVRVESNGRE